MSMLLLPIYFDRTTMISDRLSLLFFQMPDRVYKLREGAIGTCSSMYVQR
ncbi:MAG: hypothetical protein HC769_37080 [Cyanobacteria bacterium CRU_2_1]|nr:hypothetical protein [Cyanobacteria bacterium CRU_2_1]